MNKLHIGLRIDKGEIMHEVACRAYAHGEAVTADERLRWLLQSVERVGKENLLLRAVSDGLEMVEASCEPYISRCEEVAGLNAIIIELDMSENCAVNMSKRLYRLVKAFMVENCMSVWKSIMQQTADYEMLQVNKLLGDMRVLVNTRVGIQRQILD